ncbi:hypothetical protein ACVWWK_002484 [Bradyrhizobium sp. LB9.1b]
MTMPLPMGMTIHTPMSHDAAVPHPAQAAHWSILRMTMASRLAAALAVCAVLWGIVWLAMR